MNTEHPRTDVSIAVPQPIGVQLDNLRVELGDTVLFDGLSLSMKRGHWTCILGPSGVGKSMLMRMILGLSDEGVSARGSVVCDDGELLSHRVSFMAQQDNLLPWMSVLENTCLGARLRGELSGPHRQDILESARFHLAEVGLSECQNALPATLSGGMRQRAALARTLVEDRPVVLMDEPFSALDAITRVRLQDMAAEVLHDRTVLLVTHDPLEALRLGDAVHVLSGRPAVLDEPLRPGAPRPRNVGDPEILSLQGELLNRLGRALT